jgi:hypothetical protein
MIRSYVAAVYLLVSLIDSSQADEAGQRFAALDLETASIAVLARCKGEAEAPRNSYSLVCQILIRRRIGGAMIWSRDFSNAREKPWRWPELSSENAK